MGNSKKESEPTAEPKLDGKVIPKKKKRRPKFRNLAASFRNLNEDSKKEKATSETKLTKPPQLKKSNDTIQSNPSDSTSSKVQLSPRKQTIMRHKKSDDHTSLAFISEAKENMKNRKRSPLVTVDDDDKYLSLLAQQNMEGKSSLFTFQSAKILVFHEQLNDEPTLSSGRLLGHGELEIFQLHNGDVTYLSCGRSFVYPLLPKLKILRIAFNQFILPLVNPERYWKIFLNTEDVSIISNLESHLQKLVQYRNLYFGTKTSKSSSSMDDTINEKTISDSEVEPVQSLTPQRQVSKTFTGMFAEIPESPPSAPISPHPIPDIDQDFISAPPKIDSDKAVTKKASSQSITSAMASLDMKVSHEPSKRISPIQEASPQFGNPLRLHHPKPTKTHRSPQLAYSPQVDETKSDSSMDSLLDEYEEHLSTSQSMTFSRSRPPSRPISMISGKPNLHKASKAVLRDDEEDEFPSTSLSGYNRSRMQNQLAPSTRSRRSSHSELYTSVSNWMEPSKEASGHSNGHINGVTGTDLSSAYKNIYKSITQRNLNQILDSNDSLKDSRTRQRNLKPIKMTSSASLHRGSFAGSLVNGSDNHNRSRSGSVSRYSEYSSVLQKGPYVDYKRKENSRPKNAASLELKSADVYKMISQYKNDNKVKRERNSGLATLFGW